MATTYPDINVFGPKCEPIPAQTHAVSDTTFKVGAMHLQAMWTPCHTKGHVCYYIPSLDSKSPPILFSGDTLFAGGVGRFFEGNAHDMYHNLFTVFAPLPKETLIYAGHEYTLSNLEFAASVEPGNLALMKKLEWAKTQRKSNKSTMPTTWGEECDTNPFLRVHEDSIQKAVLETDPVQALAKLRHLKNKW